MVQLAALTVYSVHMWERGMVFMTEFKVVIAISVDKVSFSITPSEPITPYRPRFFGLPLC